MRDGTPARTIYLAEYKPPEFLVDTVSLDVDIHPGGTVVRSQLAMRRNPARDDAPADCVLDGEGLQLDAIALDGASLSPERYSHDASSLTIRDVPEAFTLSVTVTIQPEANTALEGLYVSRGMYCTQCEAEGFRHITFFPDRPDVLSRFTTTVRADRARYPVLLSNGNKVAEGEDGDRHWVTWEDPFAKPCYLFALVAGDLAFIEDEYVTCSDRTVTLRLYAEGRDLDKLGHAMDSLKHAMDWDERVYGREYDLDIYMIVAVSHFNMGAMENKGLNIFNTSCVLAHPDTTTDLGYQRVESVVAHEYFHNWSGNRVTCRDWFQLSLKEGFTVYRDQEFSADMNSRAVKRVEDVDMLRTIQFAEDAGPMAHPVRPDQYQKIDNFYTVTIYEKGAELVRMQANLLGPRAFRRATDQYFDRFDGQAATCDDFVDCVEEQAGMDMSVFRRWYHQAGTPQLTVTDRYENGEYVLEVSQKTPATPGQPEKAPVMIPLALALIDGSGELMVLNDAGDRETVLIIDQARQVFRFRLPEKPVPSLLRNASAPVQLSYAYSHEQLAALVAHDTDGYCRWDAVQRLYLSALDALLEDQAPDQVTRPLVPVLEQVLARAGEDPAATALLLELPSEKSLAERYTPVQPDRLFEARLALARSLGVALAQPLVRVFKDHRVREAYSPNATQAGQRALSHAALTWLVAAEGADVSGWLDDLYHGADNMTDRLMALKLSLFHGLPVAQAMLEDMASRWGDEDLVMDQWFAAQAAVPGEGAASRAAALLEDARFDWASPNRVRAVVGTLVNRNLSGFHAASGDGYQVFGQALARLDQLNPQVAARVAGAAAILPRLEDGRQALLRGVLDGLKADGCSDNLDEVLGRILGT
jgi:aminopeptidase N